MPPKRKATAKKNAPKPAKMAKQDSVKANIAAAQKALKKEGKTVRKNIAVDKFCYKKGVKVHDDWDCMLNQTNIGHNNNKYYVIQLLESDNGKCYYVWNRWGRVGESGANACHSFTDLDKAKDCFRKKFTDKTKNKWENRDTFQAVPGKYTLLEMGDEEEGEEEETSQVVDTTSAANKPVGKCSLDKAVQDLLQQIFDNDMFKHQMTKMNLNITRMPLGKLSKAQIAKGFEALDKIDEQLKKPSKDYAKLKELSSHFYTVIPHDFGRTVPPVIGDKDQLRQKLDMLLVLGDIQEAQEMKKVQESREKQGGPHPLDIKYESLNCKVRKCDKNEKVFKLVETYLKNTARQGCVPAIVNLFEIDRSGEEERIQKHKDIKFRKLLWHGTSPAVVAAILKSGLRIMPHSGGLVGKGIYFASEHGKSYGYTGRTGNNRGFMFLNEVALGKPKEIFQFDGSLTAAPPGYDSVWGKGRQEPDDKCDEKLKLPEGKSLTEIIVPQGKPKPNAKNSSFYHSEYLVYRESQVRMRYLVELDCSKG